MDEDRRFGRIDKTIWGAHAYTMFSNGYDDYMSAYAKSSPDIIIHCDWWKNIVPMRYATTKSFFIQNNNGKTKNYCIDMDAETLKEFGL